MDFYNVGTVLSVSNRMLCATNDLGHVVSWAINFFKGPAVGAIYTLNGHNFRLFHPHTNPLPQGKDVKGNRNQ